MKHFATTGFWSCYEHLPEPARKVADEKCELLRANPGHPSLQLTKVGVFWSVRVGRRYRALAKERDEGLV